MTFRLGFIDATLKRELNRAWAIIWRKLDPTQIMGQFVNVAMQGEAHRGLITRRKDRGGSETANQYFLFTPDYTFDYPPFMLIASSNDRKFDLSAPFVYPRAQRVTVGVQCVIQLRGRRIPSS